MGCDDVLAAVALAAAGSSVTARQRGIAAKVRAYAVELVAVAKPLGVGYETCVTLPAQFTPYSAPRPVRVRLIRLPDTVAYREDVRPGKGRQVPRWRTLARVA